MGVSDLPVAKIRTIPTTRITYFVTEYQQNAQFYVIVRDRSSWIEAFAPRVIFLRRDLRSEEHTSELQSLMRISYAVFCLKKKTDRINMLYEYYTHQHPSPLPQNLNQITCNY